MNLGRHQERYCIIGNPVEHSLSPLIMNYLFHRYGLNAYYYKARVLENELGEAVQTLRGLRVKGFNVTMPHKKAILRYLSDLDDASYIIKAANTVKNVDGRLIGFNTDWVGVKRSLEFHGLNKIENAVIMGAGGAAAAALYALGQMSRGIIYIINRTYENAVGIKHEFRDLRAEIKPLLLSKENLREAIGDASLLINATPVGMGEWKSLVPPEFLKGEIYVMDMVYRPLKTKLLMDAEKAGATTIDGLWMLIIQAAEAFKIWTGIEPDILDLRRLVEANING